MLRLSVRNGIVRAARGVNSLSAVRCAAVPIAQSHTDANRCQYSSHA